MAHQSIWTNPKAKKLARSLGISLPHAVGHLECLWTAAYDHCLPHGRVPEDEVEIIAQWDGEEGNFVNCMKTIGFLFVRGKYLYIKNFERHIPDYVRKRIERNYPTEPKMSGQSPDNVQETAPMSGRCPPTQDTPDTQPKSSKTPNPAPDIGPQVNAALGMVENNAALVFQIPKIKDILILCEVHDHMELARLSEKARATPLNMARMLVQIKQFPPKGHTIKKPIGYAMSIFKKAKDQGEIALATEQAIRFVADVMKGTIDNAKNRKGGFKKA